MSKIIYFFTRRGNVIYLTYNNVRERKLHIHIGNNMCPHKTEKPCQNTNNRKYDNYKFEIFTGRHFSCEFYLKPKYKFLKILHAVVLFYYCLQII